MTAKRTIDIRVLPGEPTDGSGKVCTHLFVRDEAGPFAEPHVLHMAPADGGQPPKLVTKKTRGRLACDPRRTVAPVVRGSVTLVTPRSDDPRAVTCPKCCKSDDYLKAMERLKAAEAGK